MHFTSDEQEYALYQPVELSLYTIRKKIALPKSEAVAIARNGEMIATPEMIKFSGLRKKKSTIVPPSNSAVWLWRPDGTAEYPAATGRYSAILKVISGSSVSSVDFVITDKAKEKSKNDAGTRSGLTLAAALGLMTWGAAIPVLAVAGVVCAIGSAADYILSVDPPSDQYKEKTQWIKREFSQLSGDPQIDQSFLPFCNNVLEAADTVNAMREALEKYDGAVLNFDRDAANDRQREYREFGGRAAEAFVKASESMENMYRVLMEELPDKFDWSRGRSMDNYLRFEPIFEEMITPEEFAKGKELIRDIVLPDQISKGWVLNTLKNLQYEFFKAPYALKMVEQWGTDRG